jgi:hypothetical protein
MGRHNQITFNTHATTNGDAITNRRIRLIFVPFSLA